MSRMSREFGLVLLGTGILTAGYFTATSPEDEMEKKADEQAATRTGHSNGSHHRTGIIPLFFFVHSPAYAGNNTGRPSSYSPTTRAGGFGGAGRAMAGGGS